MITIMIIIIIFIIELVINSYYMTTIVHTLWLAAEQARISCNDLAL